ncbi:tRNA(adenine34) deaminase [Methylopila capsulata]|uniref:tRNA(Adenine34) deaminase n=1 Tax=Methylopila capsulata TaxID=61654 RepID=A0A9W6MRW2_9HYPH|nr:deaminase [Methylopila capsulata]MBM7850326.1 tRNA(adenine34) deaminase [Methylopila capsulata]GLK55619.1 tRNA-specific adenosine deaminase [Methylopila capsulata]
MDDRFDHEMMGYALEEARQALAKAHFPVGAVLTIGERVVATGHKAMGSNHLDHAEMVVFRAVFQGDYDYSRQDSLGLYTTLEPCIMCWGALRHLPITRLVYAMEDAYGGCAEVPDDVLPPRHRGRPVAIRRGVRRGEARALFSQFLDSTQEPFWLTGGAPEFAAAVRSSGG